MVSRGLGRAPDALVLASGSPQRLAFLRALGWEPQVVVPDLEELQEGDPAEVVRSNATAKCRVGSQAGPTGALVVAGDTEVVVDGEVLGKPASESEAERYLRLLSGRAHSVYGAVAVLDGASSEGEPRSEVSITEVVFAPLDEVALEASLASGEWRGRAGGYAIQGIGSGSIVEVRGDLSNVIGLSLPALARLAPMLMVPARHNRG